MSQLITRIQSSSDFVEILCKDGEKEYFKEIEIDEYIKEIKKHNTPSARGYRVKDDILLLDDGFIGIGQFCKIIKQDEHHRIVTFKSKSYKINFPNSIYFLFHDEKKVTGIEAYSFKKYEGSKTKLFKYPFPNMLYGNAVCMGSAPKEITEENYVEVLEKIIFTQYTHSNVDHIKSFKDTIKYFEYLEKNKFPYDLLISLKQTLEWVVNN